MEYKTFSDLKEGDFIYSLNNGKITKRKITRIINTRGNLIINGLYAFWVSISACYTHQNNLVYDTYTSKRMLATDLSLLVKPACEYLDKRIAENTAKLEKLKKLRGLVFQKPL